MKTLLDTNIIVHAHNLSSPHQLRASKIIQDALHSKLDACITPQILYEFFAVVTNRRRVDQPLSITEALNICEDLWLSPEIKVIEAHSSTTSTVFSLTKQYEIRGAQIFDCVIAATAHEHGIKRVLTENIKDFRIFDFLEVINPFQ